MTPRLRLGRNLPASRNDNVPALHAYRWRLAATTALMSHGDAFVRRAVSWREHEIAWDIAATWTDDAIRLGVGAPPEIGKQTIRASNERRTANKKFQGP